MRLFTQSRRFAPAFAVLLAGLLPIVGCSDSPTDGDNNSGNSPEAITSDYYIQAKVDGKYKTVQSKTINPTTEMGMGHSSHEGTLTDGYLVSHTTFFSTVSVSMAGPVIDRTETFSITFVGVFDENPYDDEDYDPLIRKGSMPFGSDDAEIDGVEIRWIDANDKEWSTAFGSGDQNGSTFQVTSEETIEYPQPWLGPYVLYKVKGTFNCTLYDDAGNSMNVTDGKFSIQSVLR